MQIALLHGWEHEHVITPLHWSRPAQGRHMELCPANYLFIFIAAPLIGYVRDTCISYRAIPLFHYIPLRMTINGILNMSPGVVI